MVASDCKLSQTVASDRIWLQTVANERKWSQTIKRPQIVVNGRKRSQIVASRRKRPQMVENGRKRSPMVASRRKRSQMVANDCKVSQTYCFTSHCSFVRMCVLSVYPAGGQTLDVDPSYDAEPVLFDATLNVGQRHRRRANINPALVQSIVTVPPACMHQQHEVLIRIICLLASTGDAGPAFNRNWVDVGLLSQPDQLLSPSNKTFVSHLYSAGPTSSTLAQHCTNVIQMFCVYWVERSSQ